MKRSGRIALCLVALSAAGCDRTPAPTPPAPSPATTDAGRPWFEESAAARGLEFRHVSGAAGAFNLPESVCGGAALFDMDDDGDLDAYLVQAGRGLVAPAPDSRNELYRNRGDGTFENVSADSGADDAGYGMGVATGDFDDDGDLDLYVTNCGPNVLLRNDGNGVFVDVTAAAGVGEPAWSSSAAFVDIDADGDLDLFVANYLHWTAAAERECRDMMGQRDYCRPDVYGAPSRDTLYRNEGDGTFTDVTRSSGVWAAVGNGLGVVCRDFDGDLDQDIYVANDRMMNVLWINLGDGTFTNEALLAGCAIDQDGQEKAGMGVDAADIDDDGDDDLLVVNLGAETDSLYRNEGSYLRDDTARVGLAVVSRPFTRFGVGFHDFDNDTRLDLYEANGRVARALTPQPGTNDPYAEPNVLFAGEPGGRFREVLPRGGTAAPLIAASRAAAFGDIDNDGGMDILVVNRDGIASLLHNEVAPRGHWLMLRVRDERGRDAIGAVVRLRVGDRHLQRHVRTDGSYLAAGDPRVHVGLGDATTATDVRVRWPDGVIERFGDLAADQVVEIRRGRGTITRH
ncbi:MAG: CRTAC1 family protein [Planctomycetota bacterium]|jgi:hypothetical protein